ncbi:uncharacterized protein ARMOST_08417 [Armillaria ostoyae]|uniref:Uncharacterized protein n=1 Tax=Armillaria ostoyae TaxID=47428 RepID=A0A284R8M5_ARMOS|nr:uncharacterized protein ARMOST_08417 [Armillaria ostoyae]
MLQSSKNLMLEFLACLIAAKGMPADRSSALILLNAEEKESGKGHRPPLQLRPSSPQSLEAPYRDPTILYAICKATTSLNASLERRSRQANELSPEYCWLMAFPTVKGLHELGFGNIERQGVFLHRVEDPSSSVEPSTKVPGATDFQGTEPAALTRFPTLAMVVAEREARKALENPGHVD